MKELFVVDSICGGRITVSPCASDSAQNAEANQGGRCHIEALNPGNFQITEGCVVRIRFSKSFEAVCGIAALLLPVAAAVLGLLCSPLIAGKIQCELTEAFKAACASASFFIAAAIVFLLSRNTHTAIHPTIIAVCKKDGSPHSIKTTI